MDIDQLINELLEALVGGIPDFNPVCRADWKDILTKSHDGAYRIGYESGYEDAQLEVADWDEPNERGDER